MSFLFLVDEGLEAFGGEHRPAADGNDRGEVGRRGAHVRHLLDRERGIVVAEGRRARDLGPFRALQRLADAVDAFGQVLGAGTARDHGVFAAVGPQLQELLAERDAHGAVVRADIGMALGARRIGIEGDDRDAGRGAALIDLVMAATSATEMAMPSTFWVTKSWMICACARRLMLDRALVDALDVAELLGTLHAAVAREVEERVVHRLGHDGELVGLRQTPAWPSSRRRCRQESSFLIIVSSTLIWRLSS